MYGSKVMFNQQKVTLVCGNVYPHFNCLVPAVGGGMETRAALFGRGLAAMERWRVNFVVSDFGQPFQTCHEGIDFHIYQDTYRSAGRNAFPRLRKRRWFPVLNRDRSDLDLFWQIPLIATYLALPALCFPRFWRRLGPQVVCCFGNNERSAEVIADCHRQGIRTILCIASDKDISPDYQPGNCKPNHYGMPCWKGHYALTTADCIVAQTEAQRESLSQLFGLPSVLIRNPVQISPGDAQRWLPREQRKFVLWIGRADDFNKRPMLFLTLAKNCPELSFLMIVSRTDEAAFLALQAARPRNLQILEHIPPAEIWDYLSRARVFVNTSRFEGFPNTFLQSAVTGVPIVSLSVDPDGMLARHCCGISAANDPQALKEAVERLYQDNALAETIATANYRYTLERHEADGRIAELETCLRELAGREASVTKVPWWAIWRRFT